MDFLVDHLVFGPDDVDLERSPLRGLGAETYILGAFNPGLTRLQNGNLLLMVRVAEALRTPVVGDDIHAIRWAGPKLYVRDAHPTMQFDTSDPRHFEFTSHGRTALGLTSLSWLLPVELSPDGLEVLDIHYDKAIEPRTDYQCYGVEDPRVSLIDGLYYMTVCSVSPERHGTSLYTSRDGLEWELQGLVLDHQNKDMVLFEGQIGGKFWALTRPIGASYFLYPRDSDYEAAPSINLATSPDALHWKPHDAPFIRALRHHATTAKVGGGAPPVLTPRGWLVLYHGVEPSKPIGVYRTFWALLDTEDPTKILRHENKSALMESNAALTKSMKDRLYLTDVVFTTGIVAQGDAYVVASGENDLACRITHMPKAIFD
jgi:predicted GH43/DUF377 family glycosyl hydrolase